MVKLNRDIHARKGWRRVQGFGFARQIGLVPVAGEEVPQLAQCMPVAFRKSEEQWHAVAIMGPVPGCNRQVQSDGRWRADFVPGFLRTYPFQLSSDGDALQLWEGYEPAPEAEDGVEPFFAGGHLTPVLTQTLGFLQAHNAGVRNLHAPLSWLEARGLLQPWRVPGVTEPAGVAVFDDLFAIDRLALEELEEPAWFDLHRLGDVGGFLSLFQVHMDSLMHAHEFRGLAWQVVSAAIQPKGRETNEPKLDDFLAAVARDYAASE